uniref:Cytochrome b-c1 complex subunit 9 n=1 Tax=Suricata suricatta TaxID=37032 RepID=A0A673TXU0_SURSU
MAAPAFTARLYSFLFRRTSTFALTIAVGALFFERAFDQGADAIYEHINEGKLWKQIGPQDGRQGGGLPVSSANKILKWMGKLGLRPTGGPFSASLRRKP